MCVFFLVIVSSYPSIYGFWLPFDIIKMHQNIVSIVVMCLFVSFNNNTTNVTGGALSKLHVDIRVDIFDMKVKNCLFSLLVLRSNFK